MKTSKNLQRYFRDAKNIPKLTNEQTNQLIQKAKQGDLEAHDQVVKAHLRYVVKLANNYEYNECYEDLIQSGNVGLIEAIEAYDPNKGMSFISYSTFWIKNKMFRCFQEDSEIHIPHTNYRLARIFNERRDEMEKVMERVPTEKEVFEKNPDLKPSEVNFVNHTRNSASSVINEETQSTLGDVVFIETGDPIKEKELKEYVANLLHKMKEQDQMVLKFRFGIGCERLNSTQIEREMDIFNAKFYVERAIQRLKKIILMEKFDKRFF